MGLVGKRKEEVSEEMPGEDGPKSGLISRNACGSSVCPTEDDDEGLERKIELGPQCPLKEQLEKDKDDESLRRWKEQLLGNVHLESVGEKLEPEVKILSLAIKSPGRANIYLLVPESGKS